MNDGVVVVAAAEGPLRTLYAISQSDGHIIVMVSGSQVRAHGPACVTI